MTIEVGTVILMLLSLILSSYAGIVSYNSKKKDEQIQAHDVSISKLETNSVVCERRLHELESNQLTSERLEEVVNKAVNAGIKTAFLEYENKVFKEKLSQKRTKKDEV